MNTDFVYVQPSHFLLLRLSGMGWDSYQGCLVDKNFWKNLS